MKFSMIHENYNVSDLDRSLEFYRQALGLEEVRRKPAADGSFIIVYMAVPGEPFELELTWLRDHPQKYDLGECEFHLAFRVDDYDAAHEKHKQMGCICYENPALAINNTPHPAVFGVDLAPPRQKICPAPPRAGAFLRRLGLWSILPAHMEAAQHHKEHHKEQHQHATNDHSPLLLRRSCPDSIPFLKKNGSQCGGCFCFCIPWTNERGGSL